MQQINTERQQTSVRLPGQLPANLIKERTALIDRKHLQQNFKSAPNRSEKLTGEKQEQEPLRRLQTDLDTHRSLSTCPTYSSLSRHSPDTRECGTQITTLTPTRAIEDNQEILYESSSPIENNHLLLADEIPFEEIEVMPVSSGFNRYPYNYYTTRAVHSPISYDASQSKTKFHGKSPRPTGVRKSPRPDESISPKKRNEINPKGPKNNPEQNGSRRVPRKETVENKNSPPPANRRSESIHRNEATRPAQRQLSSLADQQDFERKPVRFANKNNNAYRPSPPSPPPPPPPPLPQPPRDTSDKPRLMRIANTEYVVQRRKQPAPDYVDDDHHTNPPVERTRPQRVVRVLRDAPYREDDDDDDGYYVEPRRRAPVVRKAPPREYEYVDENRAPVVRRAVPREYDHADESRAPVVRRAPPREYHYDDESPPPIRRRARRPEVYYIEDDHPVEHEDEYIYVDEDGNEIDFPDERNQSGPHREYIYDDDDEDKDHRRSHKPKVVYDDEDDDRDHRRSHKPKVVYDDEDDDRDHRRSHKPKVVYVDDDDDRDQRRSRKQKVIYVDDDDAPIHQGKTRNKSKQPSSTRIVYE